MESFLLASPSFSFHRKKVHFVIALGVFWSALLNKNQVTKEQSDFPGFEEFFTTKGIKGNVQYYSYYYEWISNLAVQYEFI